MFNSRHIENIKLKHNLSGFASFNNKDAFSLNLYELYMMCPRNESYILQFNQNVLIGFYWYIYK